MDERVIRITPEIPKIRKSKRAEAGLLIWSKLPTQVRLNPLKAQVATQQELLRIVETNIQNQLALTRSLAEKVREATEQAKEQQQAMKVVEKYEKIGEKAKVVTAQVVGPEEFRRVKRELPTIIEREARNLLDKVSKLRRPILPLALQAQLKFYEKNAAELRNRIAHLQGIAASFGFEISGTIVEQAIREAEMLARDFESRAQKIREQLSRWRKERTED